MHIVRSRGAVYCYAWRGGPRLYLPPDHPEFEQEYNRVRQEHRGTGGKRKLVLPGSKKAALTLDSALMAAMENARQRALKRSITFDLSRAYLLDLLEQAGGKCALSGIPFDPLFDREAKHAHNPYGISIDRIDCKGGYVAGNVRLVLTALNFAINQWGLKTYLEIARSVIAGAAAAGE